MREEDPNRNKKKEVF